MDNSSHSKVLTLKDKRNIGYIEYGDPKGYPLFFFHGWPCSRLHGAVTDNAAMKLKIRVISLDRPGYGLSDFQKDRTLLDFADDIAEIADKLKIKKFSVLGVSGGGPYTAACALKIPQRIHKAGIVVGLSPIKPGLLDGTSFFAKFCWGNYHRFPFMRTTASLFQLIISRYSPGLGIHRFLWGAKSDKKIYDQKVVRISSQKNYREAFKQGYKGPELDLKLYTDDWGFSLKKINHPVLLWYGEDDKNVSVKMGEYYHQQLPNSTLTIYPNEGHLISRTHVEEILKQLI